MFHLSLPVESISKSKDFYKNLFQAEVRDIDKKSSNIYVFGGYITVHEKPCSGAFQELKNSMHFGAEVSREEWLENKRLAENMHISFVKIVNPDKNNNNRGKFVINDPSGYFVELNSISE